MIQYHESEYGHYLVHPNTIKFLQSLNMHEVATKLVLPCTKPYSKLDIQSSETA